MSVDHKPISIRVSSPKAEGVLQVSKWLKIQVLLDEHEMQDLLRFLEEVHFVCVSEPISSEEAVVSSAAFLEKYREYVHFLKQSQVPLPREFRRYFSSAMAVNLDPFYAIAVGIGKYLIKPIEPVIQLQAHSFFYSRQDGKFHPMVLSEDSISWGLQFSYPQVFQDLKTREVGRVSSNSKFSNNALFAKLSKWIRSHTLPTPFEVGGVKTNSPIRIGKKSLSWIKNHPQLKEKGITIRELTHHS